MDSRQLARRGRAIEHLFDAVLIADRQSLVVDLNPAAERLFAVGRDEALGKRLTDILESERDSAPLDGVTGPFTPEGNWRGHSQAPRDDGRALNIEVRMVPLFDDLGDHDGAVCICRDITRRVRQEEELGRLAHLDQLTGLPNRSLFTDRVKHMLAHGRRTGERVGLLFIDLDGFKAVNDKAGHAAGDEALRVIAQRLQRVLRENDTLARWGGDEFTVLLADIQERHNAEFVAEKLLETMIWPIAVAGQRYRLGASIGIAIAPRHGDSPEALIQAADKAMYEAKGNGGQCYAVAKGGAEESAA